MLSYGVAQAAAGIACSWLMTSRPLLWLLLWEAWLAAVAGMSWRRPEVLQRPLVLLLAAYAAPCVVALAPLELWSGLVRAVCVVLLLLGLGACCCAGHDGGSGAAAAAAQQGTQQGAASIATCKSKQQ